VYQQEKNNPMNTPLVSICCITYNHAPFIRECIDGFLMQQTDFEFEIIIHDDASNDGTKEILLEYKNKYPDKFNLVLQNENQWTKGARGIFARFTFPRAKGKYIALCEGDDYWTDPLKLQKQVDFLEGNEEYSAVMHRLKLYFQDNSDQNELYNGANYDRICSVEDVLDFSLDGTASLLFRHNLINKPFDVFSKFKNGDSLLFLLLASKGKIKYFSTAMGVYRKHNGGLTNNPIFSGYNYFMETRKFLSFADSYSNFKLSKTILESKLRLMRWTAEPDSIAKSKRFKIRALKIYYKLCISVLFRLNLNVNKLLNL
jgi:glycosyltransferase involved in cell wall biosynthesis